MNFGSITLVFFKSIFRIFYGRLFHHAISRDLGNNRLHLLGVDFPRILVILIQIEVFWVVRPFELIYVDAVVPVTLV